MDKTTILHNTTIQTVKKSNDSEHFTETLLCDEIHENLRALALLNPFSDEFKEIFEKRMFTKPNTKAFPHVMKYLLMMCDATEFKKKFCWPIYNKAAEATFRNSTLELLNKLNSKYNLGFGEVKNKILIFPGGMEFMRVIYELTRLAMRIILKRNGVNDPENQPPIGLTAATQHLDELESLCKDYMDFKKKVDDYSVQFKNKIEILRKLLEKLTRNTNITPENILFDKFTDSWENVHSDIVNRGIRPDVARLQKFQNNCQKLEEKIHTVFKSQRITFNINALVGFASGIQKTYPQHYQEMSAVVLNGNFNLDHMLLGFRLALPSLLQSIEMHKPRSVCAMTYESNQLQKLSHRSDDLLQKTLQLDATCDVDEMEIENKNKNHNLTSAFENIQSMILSTPTIPNAAVRQAENAAIQFRRISLLDDAYHSRANALLPITSTKLSNRINNSPRTVETKLFLSPARLLGKESKISKLDPMAMLQSIAKKEIKDKDSSNGKFKPKSMNFGQRLAIGNHPLDIFKSNDTTLSVPDFSSTLINQLHDGKVDSVNEQINTSLAFSNDRKVRSILTVDSSNRDINGSPSGRLEPLVTSKLDLSDIKPTKLIDKGLDVELNQSLSLSGVAPLGEISTLEEKSPIGADDIARKISHIDIRNIENNQNASNKLAFNLNSMIDENDESLLNMSDHILKDLDDIDLI